MGAGAGSPVCGARIDGLVCGCILGRHRRLVQLPSTPCALREGPRTAAAAIRLLAWLLACMHARVPCTHKTFYNALCI